MCIENYEIKIFYNAYASADRESLNEELAKALAKQPVEKQNLWTDAVRHGGLTYAVFKHTVPQGHATKQVGPAGHALYLSWPQNPVSLGDITIGTDYGLPIEKPVENLLKAINFLGIETRYPGEAETNFGYGRQFGGRPWVEIERKAESLATMQVITGLFNEDSKIKWTCDSSGRGRHGFVVIPDAGNSCSLAELQKSCEDLAQFIFERAQLEPF